MADEYKSIYSGQEVDNAVATAQKALTTDNLVQTTGPSPNNVMSQAATTAAIQNIKAGTTVTVNNVAQTTWNADTKVDVFQGIDNTGKVMVVNSSGNLQAETIQSGGTTVTVNGQAQATWNADTKINVFQGVENAGKFLSVNETGDIFAVDLPENANILTGTEEKPIILYDDIEEGKVYFLSGYYKISQVSTSTNLFPSNDTRKYIVCYILGTSSSGQKSIATFGCNLGINQSLRNPNYISISYINNTNTGFSSESFIGLRTINNTFSAYDIYAPTSSGTLGQVLQSNGYGRAPTWTNMPSTTTETLTIASTAWTTLSDSSPYTYSATVTATTTIGTDSIVELINNQAVLFATYGFAIGSISGQNITIYSIGQPSENVTLTLGVTG